MLRQPPTPDGSLNTKRSPTGTSGIPLHSVDSTLQRDYSTWVRIAIALMAIGYAGSAAAGWLLNDSFPVTEPIMLLGALIAFGILRSGRIRLASLFLVSLIWCEIMAAVLLEGSLVTYVGAPAYPVLVVMVGLLLGRGGALAMALVNSAGVPLAVFLGHRWFYSLEPIDSGAEIYACIVLAMTCLAAAALVHAGQSTLSSLAARGREEERRAIQLGKIVEEAAGEILVMGLEPREFLFVSRGAHENLGYTADTLRRAPVESVIPDLGTELLEAGTRGNDESSSMHRTVLRRSDGSVYPVELRIEPGSLGSRHVLIILAVDITEQERADADRAALDARLQQTQKLDAVGLLAGGVAHDFNNLLTVIGGNADLIVAKSEGEPKALAERILMAYEQGALLTRKLLTFARKEVTRPRVLTMPDVIHETRPLLAALLGEGITLDISDEGTGTIVADSGQIEQVLLNLAANARDSMPSGGEVRIECDVGQTRPGYFRISVMDTGSGMDETVRERAFEPFFTTKPRGKGTGLGLSTVHGIVSQNDGLIEIDSTPDQGTRVTVFWPIGAEETAQRTPLAEKPLALGAGQSILVVEDNEATRHVTCLQLEEASYEVTSAVDGDQALLLLDGGFRPDLLLTDVVMPGMSGIALAERVRTEWPDIPVLMMSGLMEGQLPGHTVARGFLQKPFRRAEILELVARTLSSIPRDRA